MTHEQVVKDIARDYKEANLGDKKCCSIYAASVLKLHLPEAAEYSMGDLYRYCFNFYEVFESYKMPVEMIPSAIICNTLDHPEIFTKSISVLVA